MADADIFIANINIWNNLDTQCLGNVVNISVSNSKTKKELK